MNAKPMNHFCLWMWVGEAVVNGDGVAVRGDHRGAVADSNLFEIVVFQMKLVMMSRLVSALRRLEEPALHLWLGEPIPIQLSFLNRCFD